VARPSPPSLASLGAGLAALLGSACAGVTPTVTALTPDARGTIWARLENGKTSITCLPNPTPPAPVPAVFWNALDPTTQVTKVVVGYQAWGNSSAGCQFAQEDDYRGLFSYPLAAVAALSTASSPISSRISAATVKFVVDGLVTDRINGGRTCQSPIGAVAVFTMLRPGGAAIPPGLVQIPDPSGLPATFSTPLNNFAPNAVEIQGFGTEFKGRIVSPGTREKATFTPGAGPGITIVEVDIRDRLQGALNRGDSSLGFMLVGSGEVAPGGPIQLDCRMLVAPDTLTVTSL